MTDLTQTQEWREARGTRHGSRPHTEGRQPMKTEAEARALAEALADRMGEGWEPEIWENSGWYYQIKKGHVTINAHHRWNSDRPSFSAWIEPENVLINGNTALQIIEHAETPEDALGFATQKANEIIERLRHAMDQLYEVAA